jgi:hypothetical protein
MNAVNHRTEFKTMCVRISRAGARQRRPEQQRLQPRDPALLAMNQNGPAVGRRGRPYRPTVRRTEENQPDSESTTTLLSAQPVSAPDGVLRGARFRGEAICIKPSVDRERR